MALSFPNNPTTDQEYSEGTRTWKWDGSKWNLINSGIKGADGESAHETVDTIADLRAFDTTQLQDGDMIRVLGHTQRGIGDGVFQFKTTPIFTLNESLTVGSNGAVSVTALQEAIAGSSANVGLTDQFYGDKIYFTGGGTAIPVGSKSYGKGETSIGLYTDSAIASGEDAFFGDDDGVYIKPDTGVGYYERIFKNRKIVTPDMYGAIPQKSLKNANPEDSYSGLQKAFDSLFPAVIPAGWYYTTQPLIIRRNKSIKHDGVFEGFEPWGGQLFMRTEAEEYGAIYTDQNIDVIELWTACEYVGLIDCTKIVDHTKRAFKVNAQARVNNAKIIVTVTGNEDSLAPDSTTGTRAFEFAFNEVDDDVDHFSESGFVSSSYFYVNAHECYSGFTDQPYASGLNHFINSNRYRFQCDSVKLPLKLMTGSHAYSRIEGFLQSRAGLLGTTEADFAVCEVHGFKSGYADVAAWDLGSGNADGKHELVFKVVNGSADSVDIGPLVKNDYVWLKMDEATKDTINFSTKLSKEEPFTIDAAQGFLKVLKKSITASEILNSNTAPIPLLTGSPGSDPGIIIHRAHIRPIGGSVDYASNTTMNLVQNPENPANHIAATFDVGGLPTTKPTSLQILPYQGYCGNSSSVDVLIHLETETGNPTDGDRTFEIVVYFEEIW